MQANGRAAYVVEACSGDDSLRHEVESLLAADKRAEGFLESMPRLLDGEPTESLEGRCVGAYEIGSRIGAGGMGEVYEARDTTLDRQVAIKVLLPGVAHDAESLIRFRREAQLLASLNHPHIAQIHGFEDAGDVCALVMELVPGPTLAERIGRTSWNSLAPTDGANKHVPLPIAEALGIAAQISSALEAAHEQGIIHRDLKPANIKVREDGRVKVLDFGLATALDQRSTQDAAVRGMSSGRADATRTGAVFGTPAYMSTEQASGKTADRRADLWAFGCILYEMLTGRRAFEGESASDVLDAVSTTEAEWERLPEKTPPAIRTLLRRCLEKNRASRLDSATAARLEIDDALATVASRVVLPERPPDLPSVQQLRADGPRRHTPGTTLRSRVLALSGVALIVTLASMAGFWFGRIQVPEDSGSWSAFTQLTDAAGEETAPSLAPDGASFAYASRRRGSWDIYVQRVGGRTTIPVAASPEGHENWPAFSPNGQRIAFSESDGDGGIFVVGATGESVKRLTDFGFNPTWSPTGDRIAFATEELWNPAARNLLGSALWVVDARGGAPTKLYDGDAMQPSWSPSGARIAFWQSVDGQRDLATIKVDDRMATTLLHDAPLDWSPTWSPDGKYVYFSSDRGGSMGIWRLAVDEQMGQALGVPEHISGGADATIALASFSSDGQSMLFRSEILSIIPVALPFDSTTERAGQPRDIVHGSAILSPTSVSPDGQWLAVGNAGAPQEDIILLRADGSELRRLTDDAARDRIPRFTPDGTALTFYSNREGRYRAWSIATDGSGLRPLTTKSDDGLFYPVLAPSASMLLVSNMGFPVKAFLLLPPWPATLSNSKPLSGRTLGRGELQPNLWSPDGRWLSGPIKASSGALVGFGVYELATGEARTVSEDDGVGTASWLPDSRRLIYVTRKGELVVVDAMSGVRRVVRTGLAPPDLDTGALAPDGRTFYYGAYRVESNIWRLQRR